MSHTRVIYIKNRSFSQISRPFRGKWKNDDSGPGVDSLEPNSSACRTLGMLRELNMDPKSLEAQTFADS